jgi:hypothetical protein
MNADRLMEFWGKLPTTQARVTVSLAAIVATTIRYVSSGEHVLANGQVTQTWTPSYEWLGFLLLLSGIDAAQFLSKRMTDSDYVAAKKGP